MCRLVTLLCLGAALALGRAAVAQPKSARPAVDAQAMGEAIRSSQESKDHYASSASYAHFLKSRLLHHGGEHRRALDELRLALVTDDSSPYLLANMAEEYARVGDLVRAERTLKRVLASRPDHHRAQLLMGRILSEGGKPSRARGHLKRAIKLAPGDPQAYLALAQVELDAGRPEEAVAAVEVLSRLQPDASRGFRQLAGVFAERGDLRRAERMFLRAVQQFPGDFESWGALAQLYDLTDRPQEAERAYAEALSRDADNVELLLAAGRCALRLGAAPRARAWFDRVLALTDEPETVVRVAFAWVATRRLEDAAEVLERAQRKTRSEPRLAFYLGLLQEKRRDPKAAAQAYARVPKGSDLHAEAQLRRASALSLSGEHALALEAFRTQAEEQPKQVAIHAAWARALERSGALGEAERLLRRALERWALPELYEALGNNLQRQARGKEAVALLEQAVRALPKEEGLVFALGAAYEREGEPELAQALIRQLLVRSPDDPAALNFLGYVLADQGGDLQEAERLVLRAVELKPDSGAFLDSLGWVHFRKGQLPSALELLERALELEPDQPVIIEHLADVHLQAGRREEAARSYRRALEALERADDPVDAKALRGRLQEKLRRLPTP